MSSVIESMPVEILTEIFSSLPTFYDLRSLVCSSRVLGSIWQANRRPICAALLFRDPSLLHKHGKLTMLVELCPHVCGPGCCKTKVFHKAAVEIYQAQQASLGTEGKTPNLTSLNLRT